MTTLARRAFPALAATILAGALLLAGCTSAEEPAAETEATSEEASPAPGEPGIVVSAADEREPAAGNPETFTGEVEILPLFDPNDATTGGAGQVTFRPGARTAWHSHPAGQHLIITEGTGWVQEEGEERITVSAGDVVWFEPGVTHWHGATDGEAMTHIAVQDTIDGSNAEWMDLVTDEQYLEQE